MKILIAIILGIMFTLAIPYLVVTFIVRSLYPSKSKKLSSFGDNYLLD